MLFKEATLVFCIFWKWCNHESLKIRKSTLLVFVYYIELHKNQFEGTALAKNDAKAVKNWFLSSTEAVENS